ncbi:unnamed protein product, partial [Phaeothamnion confervicola]
PPSLRSSAFAPRCAATVAPMRPRGASASGAGAVRMGFFGLGAPEIAVIVVVAAVILGPDKLTGLAKDVGKMAGELKEVPKEFQAGIEEGERTTKVRKDDPAQVDDAE